MKKFSDSETDLLISLWHSDPCLWDSTKRSYVMLMTEEQPWPHDDIGRPTYFCVHCR